MLMRCLSSSVNGIISLTSTLRHQVRDVRDTNVVHMSVWLVFTCKNDEDACTFVMASSHRRHRQDKTVLSCLVIVHGVNWIGDKSRLSATENFESFFKSRNVVWTESCLVLTQFSIHNVVTYCDVIFGNWVKTSSQMHLRSHCRRDSTKLFSLQYIENSLQLSQT